MGMKEREKLLTTKQAAKEWNVAIWLIYDKVREGKLRPIVGLGKSWRFKESDIDSLLERL